VPEKVRPENPGKLLQIQLENLAASNCRYGRKIPASNNLIWPENLAASNCRYGRKITASNYQIRPENLAFCNYRNGWKIPARNTMNVIANCTQGCRGAVVEYLLPILKPTLCSNTFPCLPENSGGVENSTENSGPHAKNFFCSMYESSLRHPVLVLEINVKLCNSVFCVHSVLKHQQNQLDLPEVRN
jgi:hypothetical protein